MTESELQELRTEAERAVQLCEIGMPITEVAIVHLAKNQIRLLNHHEQVIRHAVQLIGAVCDKHKQQAADIPWAKFIADGHAKCSYCRNERERKLLRLIHQVNQHFDCSAGMSLSDTREIDDLPGLNRLFREIVEVLND